MNPLFILATCGGEAAIISDEIRYCAGGLGIGVTLALVLLSLHQRTFAWAPLYGSLLLLHPAWMMSLGADDCGLGMRFLSVSASLTLAAILICQIFWPGLNKQRFILSLCLISWATYFAAVLLYEFWMPRFGVDDGGSVFALSSFIVGGMDLRPIALALTFVCFVQGLFGRIRHTPFSQPNVQSESSDQESGSSDAKPDPRSRLPLRIVSAVLSLLLLSWVILYLSGFGTRAIESTVAAIFALAWSVILITTVVRGKFPGWESAGRIGKYVRI